MVKIKKNFGIIWAIGFIISFTLISLVGQKIFSGGSWYLFSGILRLIFGIAILSAMKRIYGKSANEILSFSGSRTALIAGIGFMIYFLYFIILMCVGIKSVSGLTPGLLVTHIFLQQLTTGFYEELNFRALIMESYFHGEKSPGRKLFYVIFSSIIFALCHLVGGGSINALVIPALAGFCFAVMYICSHNIVLPMIFHFVYDIVANLAQYAKFNDSSLFLMLNHSAFIYYGVIIAAFAISLIMLLRKEKAETAV